MKKYVVALLLSLSLFDFAQAAAPTNGLVAHFPFDDGTATDSTGSNSGSVNGATPVSGKVGQGLQFDGGDYVQAPHISVLESGDWTFSLWVQPSALSGVRMLLNQYDTNRGPILYIAGTNLEWQIGGGDLLTSGNTFTVGEWTHITVTAQGSQLRVYKNGVETGGSPKTITRTDGGASAFFIGGPAKAGVAPFVGMLDEVRIYNRALEVAEINDIYTATMGGGGNPPPVDPPPTPPSAFTLNVSKSGTGSGTVTGGSINCGSTCSQSSITSGTSITLTATPAIGSTFAGWSGGSCSGTGSCSTNVTANTTITATFNTTAVSTTDANFYISQNGSGDGTSCASALPATWFNTTSNWGTAAGKIGPSDIVHLCGTISTPLRLLGSGTAGNPITILFEPGAKMSAPHWNQGGTNDGAISGSGLSYITIDGGTNGIIEATASGTALPHKSISNGVVFLDGSNGITVKNLTIRNLYVRTPESADDTYVANGIYFKGGFTNITITGNTTSNAGSGIYFGYRQGSRDLTISGNTLSAHGIGLVIGSETSGASLTNVRIFNNDFSANKEWSGHPDIHTNLMHMYAVQPSTSVTNAYVYNNNFRGNMGRYPTSLAFFEGYLNAPLIYNNLFFHDTFVGGNGDLTIKGADGVRIMNNTFDSNNGGTAIGLTDWTGFDRAIITNNLILNHGYGVYDSTTGKIQSADYNLYYPASTLFRFNNASAQTFALWKAAGFDAHGVSANPLLDSNYRPQTGSPVINAGLSLAQYFTSDKDGNARGATWDIGAYEFLGAGSQTPVVGDFDGDGDVDALDYSYLNTHWETTDARADLNKDGRVNTLDYSLLAKNWTQ